MSAGTQKSLGLWTLTALVAGNMIGSGIFMLPSALANFGTIGIVAWALTAVGTMFLALVFCRLSRQFPRTGGPYIYCHEAYGDFIGFQVAYNYWIALWVGNAAIALTFVGYIAPFFPELAHNKLMALGVTLGVLWLITFINIMGVREAGKVQLVTTILKLVPLIAIATIGLFFVKLKNLAHFNVSGLPHISALTAAATLTMWSFIGFESATVPADNVINPTRNIPRATIIGTSIAAVVYIFSTISVMGVMPMSVLAKSTSPFAAAAQVMFGSWGGELVAAAGAIACFGTLNGWVLMQGQVPMAAARDGLFPEAFARVSKNGTPYFGLIISSLLITAMMILQYGSSLVELFTKVILLATLASLVPYIYTSVAEILLLMRSDERFNKQRLRKAGLLAALAFIYTFWAIIGSGIQTIAYGMLLFISGIPAYIWLEGRKLKASLKTNP